MNKALAIQHLYPQAQILADFVVSQDEKGQFISHWSLDAPEPTEEELEAAWEQVQAAEYRVKRAAEYPSVGDQLDALFKAGLFPADMAAKIQAVKDKHPKP
jgi:hypothetical protein